VIAVFVGVALAHPIRPSHVAPAVFNRSNTPEAVLLRINAALVQHGVVVEAGRDRWSDAALGTRSPAICSIVNWSNGMSAFSARINHRATARSSGGGPFKPVRVGVTRDPSSGAPSVPVAWGGQQPFHHRS
jgi:hypothetical protein